VINRKWHSCVFRVEQSHSWFSWPGKPTRPAISRFPGQENHSCDVSTQKTHSCGFLIILIKFSLFSNFLATWECTSPDSRSLSVLLSFQRFRHLKITFLILSNFIRIFLIINRFIIKLRCNILIKKCFCMCFEFFFPFLAISLLLELFKLNALVEN
jgi:hypothetical protein